jgi:hypothetical protein
MVGDSDIISSLKIVVLVIEQNLFRQAAEIEESQFLICLHLLMASYVVTDYWKEENEYLI